MNQRRLSRPDGYRFRVADRRRFSAGHGRQSSRAVTGRSPPRTAVNTGTARFRRTRRSRGGLPADPAHTGGAVCAYSRTRPGGQKVRRSQRCLSPEWGEVSRKRTVVEFIGCTGSPSRKWRAYVPVCSSRIRRPHCRRIRAMDSPQPRQLEDSSVSPDRSVTIAGPAVAGALLRSGNQLEKAMISKF